MRGRQKFGEAMVPVPERYAEWAFEYRTGYNDGLTKKAWAWSPALGKMYHTQRHRAYTAGRRAGRKAREEKKNA